MAGAACTGNSLVCSVSANFCVVCFTYDMNEGLLCCQMDPSDGKFHRRIAERSFQRSHIHSEVSAEAEVVQSAICFRVSLRACLGRGPETAAEMLGRRELVYPED